MVYSVIPFGRRVRRMLEGAIGYEALTQLYTMLSTKTYAQTHRNALVRTHPHTGVLR